MRRVLVSVFSAVAVASCGGAQHRDAATGGADDQSRAIERAQTIGRAIYRDDDASARASDAMIAANVPGDGLLGWITQARGSDRFDVTFVGGSVKALRADYVVHVTTSSADVEKIEPPRPLDPNAAAMFRARTLVAATAKDLAQRAGTELCATQYNAVVLPGSLRGETGWLVYLLAATTDPNRRFLTGHMLVHVSADGESVIAVTALSKTCLTADLKPGVKSEGMYVTHLLDPTPIETHVFTSLLYKAPVLVAAGGKTWLVDGDHITTIVMPHE